MHYWKPISNSSRVLSFCAGAQDEVRLSDCTKASNMLMAVGDAAGTVPSCFARHMSAGLPHGSINQEIFHQFNPTTSHSQSSNGSKHFGKSVWYNQVVITSIFGKQKWFNWRCKWLEYFMIDADIWWPFGLVLSGGARLALYWVSAVLHIGYNRLKVKLRGLHMPVKT